LLKLTKCSKLNSLKKGVCLADPIKWTTIDDNSL